MSSFECILVANRGEIALRVMRTAKALGYKTVAIYSDADVEAPHVRFADDAVRVGPAPVGESYLVGEKIIAAAKASKAHAIHPGYGFLSENAQFAAACEAAGLTFIGPTPSAINLMGNKAAAKRLMIEANVPCVPGYEDEDQSDDALLRAGRDIGFPLMVKAAAGGGGRGMRLVHAANELPVAIETARSEARNAFGSGELILEKAIIRPRHVEVQVFADTHGNCVYLGERDCSVQRRHQKVVEEAPCPVMTDELRARMGRAAVDAAQSIDYRGAGTVEFLLDEFGEFYFLEMNTRLQVEHPVTEMITGLDLVELQIKVAQGEPLGMSQEDVRLDGHAIEVRLYAEDPAQDFLPMTGRVDLWAPAEGEGVRIDAGIETGSEISPFYDPMIAKVIAWGPTRDVANSRLIDALARTRVFGATTNKNFLLEVLGKPAFRAGAATTAFIAEEFSETELAPKAVTPKEAAIAAVLLYETEREAAHGASLGVNRELLNWGSHGALVSHYKFGGGEDATDVELHVNGANRYEARMGGVTAHVELIERHEGAAKIAVDDRRSIIGYHLPSTGQIQMDIGARTLSLRNEIVFAGLAEEAGGGGRVVAPMHGTLLELLVGAGDTVEKGARLAVLEAMKMQHDILAEVSGAVTEIFGEAGAQIGADDLILVIEPDDG